jgi:uncharacterized protein (DUF952 family)
MKIIHIIEASSWQIRNNQSEYFGDSLQTQGFIHCCLPTQVDFVVKTWFAGREDLVLLEIDSEKLTARLVFENLEGGEEKFPHIYGPINKDAIIGWYPSRKTKGS